MWELGRDVFQRGGASADGKWCPVNCDANQSSGLGRPRSPILEHYAWLSLTHSLFRINMPKGRATQTSWSEKNDSGSSYFAIAYSTGRCILRLTCFVRNNVQEYTSPLTGDEVLTNRWMVVISLCAAWSIDMAFPSQPHLLEILVRHFDA
jgi:hypothetical protein